MDVSEMMAFAIMAGATARNMRDGIDPDGDDKARLLVTMGYLDGVINATAGMLNVIDGKSSASDVYENVIGYVRHLESVVGGGGDGDGSD